MGASSNSSYDEKYPGLPIMVRRSKYNAFNAIKESVWQKLSTWKNQFLSFIGKEILIKAVVQAISTYHMNAFKLPLRLCKEISAMMAGHKQNEEKIHWRSWDKMGVAKDKGGWSLGT